jgi:hypothetical protein
MTEFEAYNYCLSQIKVLTERLMNMGFDYDDQHGWYNYYNHRLNEKQQQEINENIQKFQKYRDFSAMLRKRLGL